MAGAGVAVLVPEAGGVAALGAGAGSGSKGMIDSVGASWRSSSLGIGRASVAAGRGSGVLAIGFCGVLRARTGRLLLRCRRYDDVFRRRRVFRVVAGTKGAPDWKDVVGGSLTSRMGMGTGSGAGLSAAATVGVANNAPQQAAAQTSRITRRFLSIVAPFRGVPPSLDASERLAKTLAGMCQFVTGGLRGAR